MVKEFFSNLANSIGSFFVWIWSKLVYFFTNLFLTTWNYIVSVFWNWYSRVISWVVSSVAALFPSDTLDYNAQVDYLVQQIAGWDQLLPIHETFLLLNVLILYHTVKIVIHFSLLFIATVRKFIPT